MVMGVTISRVMAHAFPETTLLVGSAELVGFLIHGIGSVPYVEWLLSPEE